MKKLLGLTLCIVFVLLTFSSSIYATTYTFESFEAGNGYGTKTKVSDNVTNVKGIWDERMGMKVGPFSKASTAKLADGITEETYIEINPADFAEGEHFTVSLGLKDKAGDYVAEATIMSQKFGDNVKVTSLVKDDFAVTITESGVYTYRWNMYVQDDKAYVEVTLLKGDTKIGTTGAVEFDGISNTDVEDIAGQEDVSVKYLWFCGVSVEKGVNVYAELPKAEEKPPADEDKAEEKPPVEDNKDDEKPPVENNKDDEKDETPKTGVENYIGIASAMVVVSLATVIVLKKRNA